MWDFAVFVCGYRSCTFFLARALIYPCTCCMLSFVVYEWIHVHHYSLCAGRELNYIIVSVAMHCALVSQIAWSVGLGGFCSNFNLFFFSFFLL